MEYPFSGSAAGFKTTKVIYDPITDVNGLIGYLPDDKSIYIAYRGSASPENWQVDLDSVKVDYDLWADECPKCKVHRGFYSAVNEISESIVAEVSSLHEQFPDYQIKVTGHSLGAALAQFTGMMLIKNGLDVENMINFGCSRLGNKAYAEFSIEKFPN